jgi:hypothetical protein
MGASPPQQSPGTSCADNNRRQDGERVAHTARREPFADENRQRYPGQRHGKPEGIQPSHFLARIMLPHRGRRSMPQRRLAIHVPCCQHKGKTWLPTPAFAWGRLCVGISMWKRPLRHVEHLFPDESLVRHAFRLAGWRRLKSRLAYDSPEAAICRQAGTTRSDESFPLFAAPQLFRKRSPWSRVASVR